MSLKDPLGQIQNSESIGSSEIVKVLKYKLEEKKKLDELIQLVLDHYLAEIGSDHINTSCIMKYELDGDILEVSYEIDDCDVITVESVDIPLSYIRDAGLNGKFKNIIEDLIGKKEDDICMNKICLRVIPKTNVLRISLKYHCEDDVFTLIGYVNDKGELFFDTSFKYDPDLHIVFSDVVSWKGGKYMLVEREPEKLYLERIDMHSGMIFNISERMPVAGCVDRNIIRDKINRPVLNEL